MTYTCILSEPASSSKQFSEPTRPVDSPPDEATAWDSLRRAREQRDYAGLSRARRAIHQANPHVFLVPLANPKSPQWLGGGHHG